jgi:hypothetical protein
MLTKRTSFGSALLIGVLVSIGPGGARALRAIFQKTDTSRQSELVVLLGRSRSLRFTSLPRR